MEIKVALLQMAGQGGDLAASRAKGEEYCRKAKALGADIALFPEMWSAGYTFPASDDDVATWRDGALGQEGEYFRHFQALARELDMAIVLTYLERWPGAPRNTAALIDRFGFVCLTYAKVHTCDFGDEAALTPGERFAVGELDTVAGPVKIGLMICYDREFPESARILMLQGAELILVPNACTMEQHRVGQLQARAYENMVGIALTNYAAPQENGHSVAFDPIIYAGDDYRDTLLVEAGGAEGVYVATFDLFQIRKYRQNEVWGNAYRRPRAYGMLLDMKVDAPFTRANDRR